jgi:tRNA pseudouridine-54 N-methylase
MLGEALAVKADEATTTKADKAKVVEADERAVLAKTEKAAAEATLMSPRLENQPGVTTRRGKFIPSPRTSPLGHMGRR